jgi:hypothetical protein
MSVENQMEKMQDTLTEIRDIAIETRSEARTINKRGCVSGNIREKKFEDDVNKLGQKVAGLPSKDDVKDAHKRIDITQRTILGLIVLAGLGTAFLEYYIKVG